MKKEEIDALISNEVRQLGLDGIFSEEVLNKIKDATFDKISKENNLVENEVVDAITPNIDIEKTPEGETQITVPIEPTTPTYEPELPSFIDKIEPEKFIVFDRNELSVGGENLSNRPFRTLDNPDNKKSIHQSWLEDGKKKADVYIAKFVKIGEIEFNYTNGLSQYIERTEEKPAVNTHGFEGNPMDTFDPVVVDGQKPVDSGDLEATIKSSLDLENKVKEYIEKIVKDNFYSQESTKISNDYPMNESVNSNEYKIREVITNEKKFKKTDTPEEIKKGLKEGVSKAKLVSKNDEVQVWVLEGIEYILPTTIISDKKSYVKVL